MEKDVRKNKKNEEGPVEYLNGVPRENGFIMKKLIWLIPVRLILTVVGLYFIPGAGRALELNRELVLHGEVWRLVTGHFVHCSLNHLFWDAAAFTVLAIVGVHKDFKRFVFVTVLAVPVISLAVLILCPEIEIYRGLSGLDTALYAYLVLYNLYEAMTDRNRMSTVLYLLLLAGLLGKNIWEVCTGNVLFCNPDGYVPVPIAHLAGMLTGFMVFCSLLLQKFRKPAEEISGILAG